LEVRLLEKKWSGEWFVGQLIAMRCGRKQHWYLDGRDSGADL